MTVSVGLPHTYICFNLDFWSAYFSVEPLDIRLKKNGNHQGFRLLSAALQVASRVLLAGFVPILSSDHLLTLT